MIIKPFSLSELKNNDFKFCLCYGENEGQKDEIISNFFLKGFKGEIIKYDEKQILENKESFYEVCLNESLFESKKIIIVLRVTSKLFEIIKDLIEKKVENKKIIFNAGILDKKSKIRNLFEKDKSLVCIPFYQDNNLSLFKIANDFFKKNNISISSENINLIVEQCAGDRRNLKNEMDKILNFSFKKNKVSQEEILKLINLYENENYFELIDSCLSKNHTKVCKIINNKSFSKNDSIILIRSFLSRIKRLIELKKLYAEKGDIKETINTFKPPIFWKDKEIVQRQMEVWSSQKVFKLLDKVTMLEISFKKNYDLSNNLIFDLLLNTSIRSNS